MIGNYKHFVAIGNHNTVAYAHTYLLLLHLLLDLVLLVLAALVLKPDAYHARRQAGHLDDLLLHEGVRPRIGVVEVSVGQNGIVWLMSTFLMKSFGFKWR